MEKELNFDVNPQPVATPEKKKNSNSLKFILIAVAQLVYALVTTLVDSLIPFIITKVFGYSSYDAYYSTEYQLVSNIGNSIGYVITTVVGLAVFIGLGYLSYKSIRGTVKFFAVGHIAMLIRTLLLSLIPSSLLSNLGISMQVISVLTTVVSILGIILSVAASVGLLILVEKFEAKKAQAEEAKVEAKENEVEAIPEESIPFAE